MTKPAVKLPNLFIVGAMKSATTSLHNYLAMHPEIFMSKYPWKEPGYFVRELNWEKGLAWYQSLFAEASNEKFLGESTTDYTKAPNYSGVPERIHALCPDAKIIYIMRDPIERAISQYWWEVQYSAEGRGMRQAIINNDWIMSASDYAVQIRPYFDVFGAENVFTLTMETLQASPEATLKELLVWLGVNSDYQLANEYKAYNRSAAQVNRVIGSSLFAHLKGTPVWQLLKMILSANLRSRLKSLLSKPVEKNKDQREETIRLLRPIMQPQVQALSELLGRDFPEWTTLYGKD
jgi:hypothetical protein